MDTAGKLKTLIEQFAAEGNAEARSALLDQIIYHWADVQDKDPNSRDPTQVYGKVIDDCQQLEALEEFMGNSLACIVTIRSYGDIDGNAYQKELLNLGQWEGNGTDKDDALYGDDTDNYLNGGDDKIVFGDGITHNNLSLKKWTII